MANLTIKASAESEATLKVTTRSIHAKKPHADSQAIFAINEGHTINIEGAHGFNLIPNEDGSFTLTLT